MAAAGATRFKNFAKSTWFGGVDVKRKMMGGLSIGVISDSWVRRRLLLCDVLEEVELVDRRRSSRAMIPEREEELPLQLEGKSASEEEALARGRQRQE